MILNGPGHLLYIEPKGSCETPIVDNLTRKLAAAFYKGQSNGCRYRGWHHSACGANSDNTDYVLDDARFTTNSLAIHYLSCHRSEIPPEELAKVASLPEEFDNPTQPDIHGDRGQTGR